MTNLQVVKALDKQIDASFKRSPSSSIEKQLREDIRNLQAVFQTAHRAEVLNRKVSEATEALLKMVSPQMGRELRAIISNYWVNQ